MGGDNENFGPRSLVFKPSIKENLYSGVIAAIHF